MNPGKRPRPLLRVRASGGASFLIAPAWLKHVIVRSRVVLGRLHKQNTNGLARSFEIDFPKQENNAPGTGAKKQFETAGWKAESTYIKTYQHKKYVIFCRKVIRYIVRPEMASWRERNYLLYYFLCFYLLFNEQTDYYVRDADK